MRSKLAKGFLQWLETGVGFPEEFFFATMRRISQGLWNKHNIVEQSMYVKGGQLRHFEALALFVDALAESFYNVKHGSSIIMSKVSQTISVMKT